MPVAENASTAKARARRTRRLGAKTQGLSMRELGKLTAEDVGQIDHPVPVTSSGRPVAWLVPLSASERRRAEMIAAGRLHPRRVEGLAGHVPLPADDSGPTLSELLTEMRGQERS